MPPYYRGKKSGKLYVTPGSKESVPNIDIAKGARFLSLQQQDLNLWYA